MKKLIALCAMLIMVLGASASKPLADKYGTFAVLGDSYSTFMGFTDPLKNAQWYPHANNAMASVEQTWWKLFEAESGVRLEQNNSFSGSTICTHSWNNSTDLVNSFVGRVDNLREAGLIIVEGATNDNNVGSTLGDYVWSGFTAAHKRTFRGGTAYVIDFLQKKYPNSKVVFMLNSGLRNDINESVQAICDHYNVPVLKLKNITKIDGHPDIAGMEAINSQLMQMLCEMEGITYITEKNRVTVTEEKDEARVLVDKPMYAGEWSSLCVPFDLSAGQIEAAFGAGTRVQGVESVSGATVSMVPVTAIEANKPYVVMPGEDVTEPWLADGVHLTKTAAISTGDKNCTVAGTYAAVAGRVGSTISYTFATDGGLYTSAANTWCVRPLSVVVKPASGTTPTATLSGYSATPMPQLTYDLTFTPAQHGAPTRTAVPLLVADPYLSVWSSTGVLSNGATKHVSYNNHQLEGYVEVDGSLYRFLGDETAGVLKAIAGTGATSAQAEQKSVDVTPTQTFVTFDAAGVRCTVVFTSTQLIDKPETMGAAVNYVSYKAQTIDGKAHNVKMYLSFASAIVSRSSSGTGCTIETDLSTGVAMGRVGMTTQKMSEGVRPNWGHLMVMADAARGQEILKNGNSNMIFCDDLGSVEGEAQDYTVVGRDEGALAIGFGYARFPAPWTRDYASFQRVMRRYAMEVNERLADSRRFDTMIYDDADRCAGTTYADMCRMSYRQVIGACKQAVSDTGDTKLYNFEAGGSGNISQADRLLVTAPLLLAYAPELAYELYAAVPDYIRMFPGFSSPYGNAPHHLGLWPIMAGSHLDNGVDSTTDICLLAASAVACGMDATELDDYEYRYLVSLCDYLDLFTQAQYEGNFAGEGSVDGSIRDNANLRLKAVIAMDGVAKIASARGNGADAARLTEMADRWEQILRSKYVSGDHLRHGETVEWGLKYPLFFHRLLGLTRLSDLEANELAYYATRSMDEYGMKLHGATSNMARVSATMLTGALTADINAWCVPVAAYMGIGSDAEEGKTLRPVGDRYNCVTGAANGFIGSSGLGSIWGKVLLKKQGLSGIESVEADSAPAVPAREGIYDLTGRRLTRISAPGIYIVNGRKTLLR